MGSRTSLSLFLFPVPAVLADNLPIVTGMAKATDTPWWLDDDGTETCDACTHRYAYHVEIRCVGCDRGLCTHCAVIESVSREPWCPVCAAEREE